MTTFFDTPDEPIDGEPSNNEGSNLISRVSRSLLGDEFVSGLEDIGGRLSNINRVVSEFFQSKSVEQNEENVTALDNVAASIKGLSQDEEDRQSILDELKNLTLENKDESIEKLDDIVAALNLLGETGIKPEDLDSVVKDIGNTFQFEKLAYKLDGIQDELIRNRISEEMERQRGGGTVPNGEVESGGFFDNMLTGLLAGTGIAGLLKNLSKLKSIKGIKELGAIAKKLPIGNALKAVGKAFFYITATFDAVTGFLDAANITGKAEENLTILDRVGAGLASALSGLTLGLVSAETVYKKAGEYFEKYSEIVENSVFWLLDKAKEYFGDQLIDDFVDGLQRIREVIVNFFSMENIKNLLAGAMNLDYLDIAGKVTNKVTDLVGGGIESTSRFLGLSRDERPKTQLVQAQRTEATPKSEAINISRMRYEESLKQKNVNPAQEIIVQTPPPVIPPERPSRRTDLGNSSLFAMGVGAFD